MQSKLAAQQEAQQAEYEFQKQTTLAKAKVAAAIGTRDANNAMQASITPAILEMKKLEKWDGHLPQVTSGASAIVDLRSK